MCYRLLPIAKACAADRRDITRGCFGEFSCFTELPDVHRMFARSHHHSFSTDFSEISEPINVDNPASLCAVSRSVLGIIESAVSFPSSNMISSMARKRMRSTLAVCANPWSSCLALIRPRLG